MIQAGGFLRKRPGPLLKAGLLLMKNVIKPSAKSALIPLGLTASAASADAGLHKKIWRSGATTVIISNGEIEDIIKIVKYLKDSGLSLKGVSELMQNEAKGQNGRLFSMLLGTLGAGLLGNILAGSGMKRAGERFIRTAYESSIKN